VRGGRNHNHRRLADVDRADPVDQDHTPEVGPATPHLGSDVGETRNDVLLVRLIIKQVDTLTARRVVAGRATEQHHRAATGQNGPVGGTANRERLRSKAKPVVAVEGRGEHHDIVGAPKQPPTERSKLLVEESGVASAMTDGG
jgi:hypothetical protein